MSPINISIHGIAAVKARRCNATVTGYPDTEWLTIDLLDAEGNVAMTVAAWSPEGGADQPVDVVDERE